MARFRSFSEWCAILFLQYALGSGLCWILAAWFTCKVIICKINTDRKQAEINVHPTAVFGMYWKGKSSYIFEHF